MIIFIVLSTAVGIATLQDYSWYDNESVNVDDFSSEEKTLKIEIRDGVGSFDNG